MRAPFLPEPLSVQCDVNRSSPVQASAVIPMRHRPVHDYFDMDMSFCVPVMTVEETVAEKLSRWQVRPLVRDLYDLSMLRPLITDPGAVARLYTIKGHRSFHNPNKGPTTAASKPVDLEHIVYPPDLNDMEPGKLQLDDPVSSADKRDMVASMLEQFPDAYGFCLDEMRDELERWGEDTDGVCAREVQQAASAFRSNAADSDAASYLAANLPAGSTKASAPSGLPAPRDLQGTVDVQTDRCGADTSGGPCQNRILAGTDTCQAGHRR